MSKEIWAKVYRAVLNGECIDEYHSGKIWVYGEKPDDTVRNTWTDFDDFYNSWVMADARFAERSRRGGKHIKLINEEIVTKKNFRKAELIETYVKVDEDISVKQLMNGLSMKDLCRYCMDKGYISNTGCWSVGNEFRWHESY